MKDKQIGEVVKESDDLYESGLWNATVDEIESSGESDLHSISLSQRMEYSHYTCVRVTTKSGAGSENQTIDYTD
jgi:hypothetical protein